MVALVRSDVNSGNKKVKVRVFEKETEFWALDVIGITSLWLWFLNQWDNLFKNILVF